jgi:hypothetical protein
LYTGSQAGHNSVSQEAFGRHPWARPIYIHTHIGEERRGKKARRPLELQFLGDGIVS